MAMDASTCSGSGPNGADSRTEPTNSSLTLSTSRRDCRNPVQSFQSRSRERPPYDWESMHVLLVFRYVPLVLLSDRFRPVDAGAGIIGSSNFGPALFAGWI